MFEKNRKKTENFINEDFGGRKFGEFSGNFSIMDFCSAGQHLF